MTDAVVTSKVTTHTAGVASEYVAILGEDKAAELLKVIQEAKGSITLSDALKQIGESGEMKDMLVAMVDSGWDINPSVSFDYVDLLSKMYANDLERNALSAAGVTSDTAMIDLVTKSHTAMNTAEKYAV